MRTLSLVGLMVLLLCPSALRAQFVYGTTGLLHMPTGEMQRDKTFMFGCAFLDTEATPGHWSYDCLLYTSPSPRDRQKSRMPSSA